jgi:CheY-like chemotaxis protein
MSQSNQKNPQETDNSKVASELNNLIQIISGTSSLIENIWEGSPGSEKYFDMLRASIERAEQVTAQLAAQAGGTNHKRVLPADLEQRFEEALTAGPVNERKHSILVVDDEPMALELLHSVLTDAGYEVGVAQSGFECLDLFRHDGSSYDLILTDLSMPLMDGEETFERLRQVDPKVKVVLMAGFVDSGRLEKMMSDGLSGFVGKPFAPVEILAVVTSVISGTDQPKEGTASDNVAAAV